MWNLNSTKFIGGELYLLINYNLNLIKIFTLFMWNLNFLFIESKLFL